MDKKFKAKNGSIRLTDEFVEITTASTYNIPYAQVKEIILNMPGVIRKGSLELRSATENKLIMLIIGYTNGGLYQKIAEKISKNSNIDIQYSKENLFTRTKPNEIEKTSDFALLFNYFGWPILCIIAIVIILKVASYIISIL